MQRLSLGLQTIGISIQGVLGKYEHGAAFFVHGLFLVAATLDSGKNSIHHYCQLSSALLVCSPPLLSAFIAPKCSHSQNCPRSTMCSCITLDGRWQNGATFFPSIESFPASPGQSLWRGQSIGRDQLKDVWCCFSECGRLVGCLQSVSTSCRMETTRFCLGNIQMPFHFGLCETFWSLPAEKQKLPRLEYVYLLVLHNCWGLRSTRKPWDLC